MDPIPILHEDESVVAVSKPGGLLVHRSPEAKGEKRFLLQTVRDQLGGDWLYPVHRLDRAASGVVLFARRPDLVGPLQAALAAEQTIKQYWALVVGQTPGAWVIDRLLTHHQTGRRQTSRTEFERVLELPTGPDHRLSQVQARLRTGRRHQIRRHLAGTRNFILGDVAYGKGRINRYHREQHGLPRLCLHAERLRIELPAHSRILELYAPLAADLQAFFERIQALGQESQSRTRKES